MLTRRDLTENLFTKEVLDEHRSRFKAAKMDKSRGRAWSQCFIPEYFLAKIEGPSKEESARLTSRTSQRALLAKNCTRGRATLPFISYATCILSLIVMSDMLPCGENLSCLVLSIDICHAFRIVEDLAHFIAEWLRPTTSKEDDGWTHTKEGAFKRPCAHGHLVLTRCQCLCLLCSRGF